MNINMKIARASAVLSAAALLGAAPAMAQEADPFAACRAAGTPTSLERSLCYRGAANLANEQIPPAPVTRPIVIDGTGFDWTDAGVRVRRGGRPRAARRGSRRGRALAAAGALTPRREPDGPSPRRVARPSTLHGSPRLGGATWHRRWIVESEGARRPQVPSDHRCTRVGGVGSRSDGPAHARPSPPEPSDAQALIATSPTCTSGALTDRCARLVAM